MELKANWKAWEEVYRKAGRKPMTFYLLWGAL